MKLLWGDCENCVILKKKSQAFFNILTEPLLVQKQTIHQQKAWDLSYLEPEGHGRGMVRRVPGSLAAKDIEKNSKFNGATSGRKIFFIDLIFDMFMLWAKCPLILNSNKVYFANLLIATIPISKMETVSSQYFEN